MRKSTVFISSVLTTFALVILYGVVRAYQNNAMAQAVAPTVVQPATSVPLVPTDTPVPTPTVVTPEEAAQLAAQVVGHDNLLSAETSTFNNIPAYLITFTNKDVVYIGLDGQVLSVQVAPVVVVAAPPKKNNNNNNNQSNNNGGGEDSHQESEGHDD